MNSHHRFEEEMSLVVREEKPSAKNRSVTIAANGAKLTLGIIGLGAGMLYLGPATSCANSLTCGEWLSNLVGKETAIGIFTAGGADFASINAYFSSKSIERFVSYLQKQESTQAKIGKGTVVLVFAFTQNIQILLASLGTRTATWQTIMTVTGAAPGALYGSVNLIDGEIPYAISKLKRLMNKLHYRIADLCSPLSEGEQLHRERIAFYERQHAKFIHQVEAKWKHIIATARNADVYGNKNPRTYLFQQTEDQQSRLGYAVHKIGQALGLGLTTIHSSGVISNTFSLIQKYLPTLPLQIASTSLLSASFIYSNIQLTVGGVTTLLDTLYNVLSGKPIESISYQLRPKTTSMVTFLALAASALSYAVIATLFDHEFPGPENDTRKGLRYSSMAGIDIYHFAGLMHFYHLLFSVMTKDQKNSFFFAIEKEVEHFHKMTLEEYIQFVEKNNNTENEIYGLQTFDQMHERALLNSDYDDEEFDVVDIASQAKVWCRCFSHSPKREEEFYPTKKTRLSSPT